MTFYGISYRYLAFSLIAIILLTWNNIYNWIHYDMTDAERLQSILHGINSNKYQYESRKDNGQVFVSYTFFSNAIYRDDLCENNLKYFLLFVRLEKYDNVNIQVNIVEGSYVPPEMYELIHATNGKIVYVKNKVIDLYTHREVLLNLKEQYDYYVLMNCGARGPYYIPKTGFGKNPPEKIEAIRKTLVGDYHQQNDVYPSWLYPFILLINTKPNYSERQVAIAGCSISCEKHVHVQSYFIVVNNIGLEFVKNVWVELYKCEDTLDIIRRAEVGLGTTVLKTKEHTIGSLQPFIINNKIEIEYNSQWDNDGNMRVKKEEPKSPLVGFLSKPPDVNKCPNPDLQVRNNFQAIFRKFSWKRHDSSAKEILASEEVMCNFIPPDSKYRCDSFLKSNFENPTKRQQKPKRKYLKKHYPQCYNHIPRKIFGGILFLTLCAFIIVFFLWKFEQEVYMTSLYHLLKSK